MPIAAVHGGDFLRALNQFGAHNMTTRTLTQTWRFPRPFTLKNSERIQAPGDYRVVTDEELIDGLSFLAYRRVSTMIFLPGAVPGGSSGEMIPVDPAELETAQGQDIARAPA